MLLASTADTRSLDERLVDEIIGRMALLAPVINGAGARTKVQVTAWIEHGTIASVTVTAKQCETRR